MSILWDELFLKKPFIYTFLDLTWSCETFCAVILIKNFYTFGFFDIAGEQAEAEVVPSSSLV